MKYLKKNWETLNIFFQEIDLQSIFNISENK